MFPIGIFAIQVEYGAFREFCLQVVYNLCPVSLMLAPFLISARKHPHQNTFANASYRVVSRTEYAMHEKASRLNSRPPWHHNTRLLGGVFPTPGESPTQCLNVSFVSLSKNHFKVPGWKSFKRF